MEEYIVVKLSISFIVNAMKEFANDRWNLKLYIFSGFVLSRLLFEFDQKKR